MKSVLVQSKTAAWGLSAKPTARQQPASLYSARATIVTKAAYDSATAYDSPTTVSAPVGAKLEKWLKTPFAIAAFGPRVSLGALASLPQITSNLQSEVQKLNELLQDPRPLPEKQQVLAEEVETRVTELVERGAMLEADLFANLAPYIPSEVKSALPQELKDLFEKPHTAEEGPAANPIANDPLQSEPLYEMQPESTIVTNQTSAEMVELKASVVQLRDALSAMRNPADPASASMRGLNLKEARNSLARRLAQLGPGANSNINPAVTSAVAEARLLLSEVDSLGL